MLLSRTAQSREPSLPKSLTQYQAEKGLLLRTRLRRVKLLKCEILLELLNNHTGDWPQLLGVHPQIHILPAFKQETFPWAQQAALCKEPVLLDSGLLLFKLTVNLQ